MICTFTKNHLSICFSLFPTLEHHGVLCSTKLLNYSKSKVSTFKFPANPKLTKQWLLKMKRKEFQPEKNSRICAVHFTEDYFRENLAIRRFLGSDFRFLMKRKEFQPEKTLAFVRFILPKTTSEKIWQYVGFWVLISSR